MSVFVAAKQRVEMAPPRTWLEQVHRNNIAHRTMKANHPFHDEVYLGKTDGRFNDIPTDFDQSVWTGTAAVIGAKGRKLKKAVETSGGYAGRSKIVLFEPNEEQLAADPDIVFMCNHGFIKNGSLWVPTLELFDVRRNNKPLYTGDPKRDEDSMQEAEIIKMSFNGPVLQKKIISRDGGFFEQFGGENSKSWFLDNAVLGLFRRVCGTLDDEWRSVYFDEFSSVRIRVALDATQDNKTQVEATARLTEQLSEK